MLNAFLIAGVIGVGCAAICPAASADATAQNPGTNAANVGSPDDRFIAGYVTAVLEHDFHLSPSTITVNQGLVRVDSKDVGAADRDRIVTALGQIRGVSRVEIVDLLTTPQGAPANQPLAAPNGAGVVTKVEPTHWTLFSPTNVFQPLLADPRWPNFSAAYDIYTSSGPYKLRDVGTVSFGESVSLYQASSESGGQFELGVQAAVFAIFNLDAFSKDLVNADYFVGPILEYRKDDLSGFLRVYHQSSHLGDEFLLDHPGIQRVNLATRRSTPSSPMIFSTRPFGCTVAADTSSIVIHLT